MFEEREFTDHRVGESGVVLHQSQSYQAAKQQYPQPLLCATDSQGDETRTLGNPTVIPEKTNAEATHLSTQA